MKKSAGALGDVACQSGGERTGDAVSGKQVVVRSAPHAGPATPNWDVASTLYGVYCRFTHCLMGAARIFLRRPAVVFPIILRSYSCTTYAYVSVCIRTLGRAGRRQSDMGRPPRRGGDARLSAFVLSRLRAAESSRSGQHLSPWAARVLRFGAESSPLCCRCRCGRTQRWSPCRLQTSSEQQQRMGAAGDVPWLQQPGSIPGIAWRASSFHASCRSPAVGGVLGCQR